MLGMPYKIKPIVAQKFEGVNYFYYLCRQLKGGGMEIKMLKKIYRFVTEPETRFGYLQKLGFMNRLDDEVFLKKIFKLKLGYELNLENPRSFNEKIQWLKIHDRNPEYTKLVDKYEVRKYISDKIGEDYLIPLLGVWDNVEDINFDKLPNKFVLKCNHNSGLGMCICENKDLLDIKKVKKELKKGLKENYYLTGREWPYKNVKRKIIAEKYMSNNFPNDLEKGLLDYKFMCFNGTVRCSFVCSERFSKEGLKVTFFDKNWNMMPFERKYPRSKKNIPKPQNYEKMIELAEKLAENIPFVRVDLYEINGKIYFGELTFHPGSGMEEFMPVDADYELGSWLNLNC